MPNTEQIRFQTDVCYIESQSILKTPESTLKLNLSEQYILSYLIDNYGNPVTKDELLKVGWPDRIVTEASLFQVIRALRVKLNEKKKGDVIETLPRVGYQIREFTRETINFQEEANLSSFKKIGKKTAIVSAIGLAAVGAGIGWMKYVPSHTPTNYIIEKDRIGSNDITIVTANADDLADLRSKVKELIKGQTKKYGKLVTQNERVYLLKTDEFYSAAWCAVDANDQCIKNTDFSYKIATDEWDKFANIVINNQKVYHETPVIQTEYAREPTAVVYTSYIDKSGIRSKVMHYFMTPTDNKGVFDYSLMSFIKDPDSGNFRALAISASKAYVENRESQFLQTIKIEPEMFHWAYQPSPDYDEKESLALKHTCHFECQSSDKRSYYNYVVYKQPNLLLMLNEFTGFFWNSTSQGDPSISYSDYFSGLVPDEKNKTNK
ncbi:winged helix-turn-helix domain-containing protein [Photobacterium leiognathi]|uniref:winged helix-turn-helix domain-containing protein n=1 Tax=Photobacterium leiognathi TaxID=553611 RepID=UPI002982022D|nr:winged helix-turn-helix domain-containing protein [Photobacterium leiognathi]